MKKTTLYIVWIEIVFVFKEEECFWGKKNLELKLIFII